MPSDVTGSSIWNQRDGDFEFRAGPIFANLLLADEINRAPPKTQAALLEAMQERQVTIEGVTHPLEPPFLVLATQNPIEYEGTYPLPEAQLDRFLLRISFGYPDADRSGRCSSGGSSGGVDEVELRPVVDRETLLALQAAMEGVHVAPSIGRYIVRSLVAATRASASASVGASPRGQPRAAQAVALPRRARRPRLRHARRREGRRGAGARAPADAAARALGAAAVGDDVVRDVLETVPTPGPRTPRPRHDALGVAAAARLGGARGARAAGRARRVVAGARRARRAVRRAARSRPAPGAARPRSASGSSSTATARSRATR